MHFLSPHLLHLAWLALIPLALYLFRKRARRVPDSTLLYFRSLSREHQESAWLRKLKKWLSLLLTLLVILLSALALGRPAGGGSKNAPGAVVIVVDRSASMAARDGDGKTRMDVAKTLLQKRLKTLPDQVILSLVAFDSKPQVLLSRSRNRRECLRLLTDLQPLPMEGRPDAALTVTRRLAELESESQIWHSGDSAFSDISDLRYAFLDAAMETPVNVGITGFQIRQSPMARDRYEAFVKVGAAKTNTTQITSTLELTLAGRLAQLRELEIAPGESTTLILPMEGVRGQRLELQLKTPGDVLSWDDAVASQLPQTRPIIVAWVAEKADPFTELAMTSMIEAGRIEILKGTPAAWPLKDKPDVYVFEGWLPDSWPTDRPVIALNPPASLGPVQLRRLQEPGLPHDSVRSVAPDHPLLFRVNTSRLAVTQTSVLQVEGSLEPLWMAGAEPILAAGETSGQRLVISAFSPARSEQLALLPAFPLLLGNALYWCAENNDAMSELRPQHPGDLLNETGLIQWNEWDGEQFKESTQEATNGLLFIQHIGAWQSNERRGTSILASATETDLPTLNRDAPITSALPAIKATAGVGDWPVLLLWAVLALLLLESWLFHRKAVF
ncbi:MAG: VWA domain-containing protein [Verrucomicrobia bacterium]|nr:VWA domain-containing protein [Verrucomicrobiota bacterium]